MKVVAYQQGHADGLCGLYSVLNFLSSLEDWKTDKPAENMEHVLNAVQATGLLSPAYLTRGYHEHQIVEVLNHIFNNFLMNFKAVQLKEIERLSGELWYDFYKRVCSVWGSIIGGPKGSNHWVLVTKSEGRHVIINSAYDSQSTKAFDKRQPEFCDEEGVAILPHVRDPIRI